MSKQIKKYLPFAFMLLILINAILSQDLLLKAIGESYTYIYTPLFWIALAAFSLWLLRNKRYRKALKRDLIFWTGVAAAMYVIVRFGTGLIEGFGYNAMSMTFFNTVRNLFAFVVPYVCREIIRAAILMDCKPGKNRTKLICVLSCAVLAFSELNFNKLIRSFATPFGMFEQLGGILMPALVESAMLTLAALYAGYIPGVIYRLGTLTLFYIMPVVPDNSWLTTALLGCLIPFVVAIVINYTIGIATHTMTRREVNGDKPGGWIALFAVLVAFVLFITGVLPVYPVAVATGSMEPNIMTGDMVIVNKTQGAKDSLEIGDVIQYQRGNFTVIHRIIDIENDHEDEYYITQGDNNNAPDSGEVTKDMVIGRVEFRVPYAGWLTLWMHSQKVEDDSQDVDVETGGHNPWTD